MIRQILSRKRPIYFISPHVDDALLSSGALIASLCKKTPVHIINIFSLCKQRRKNSPPLVAGEEKSIFERKQIEKRLLKGQDVTLHYLELPDLLIRSKNPLYYKSLPHILTKSEDGLCREIRKRVRRVVPNDSIIFCPLATGGHMDHLIVRRVCVDLFHMSHIYFWKDYPYSLLFDPYRDSFINSEFYRKLSEYTYSTNLIKKGVILHSFKKYLKEFFSKGAPHVPLFPETYFYSKIHSDK